MLLINQIIVALVTLGVVVITVNPQETLRRAAQEALDAINSNRQLTASNSRADRGQHVFNNGLIGFPRSVLQDLLNQGNSDQLNNLMQHLNIPLSQTEQNAISSWVVHFSPEEPYVDYNAVVFGEYVSQLRSALVEYLRAEASVDQNVRDRIQEKRRRVQHIASEMANHEVYVDPMARDRWLHENQNSVRNYEQVRDKLKNMFQNILQVFEKVPEKIRRNN